MAFAVICDFLALLFVLNNIMSFKYILTNFLSLMSTLLRV